MKNRDILHSITYCITDDKKHLGFWDFETEITKELRKVLAGSLSHTRARTD